MNLQDEVDRLSANLEGLRSTMKAHVDYLDRKLVALEVSARQSDERQAAAHPWSVDIERRVAALESEKDLVPGPVFRVIDDLLMNVNLRSQDTTDRLLILEAMAKRDRDSGAATSFLPT